MGAEGSGGAIPGARLSVRRRSVEEKRHQRIARCAASGKKFIKAEFADAAIPRALPTMENAKARGVKVNSQTPRIFVADFGTAKTTMKLAL
jgi:hypothetical protein